MSTRNKEISPYGFVNMNNMGSLCVDYTHVGRRGTGIERITQELFGADALADIPFRHFKTSSGRIFVLAAQMVGLPLSALFRPRDMFVFPGFPPSPMFGLARERCVLYVHDLFLMTRRHDLNFAGKLYLAPLFSFAVKRLRYYFVNSEKTGRSLGSLCRQDAQIMLYRPHIRNVFNLSVGDRAQRASEPSILRVAAIGTVEPRKNFLVAAEICSALARLRGGPVELNIVGRHGWGRDWDELAKRPDIILHGALSDAQVRQVIEAADIFICSSHDEGLGLPLLEVQHGGLPTVAPDQDVFREVLGASGIYVDPAIPGEAAAVIMKACAGKTWRHKRAEAAIANVQRWNSLASEDHRLALLFLQQMLTKQGVGSRI
jgi:glycosyltransferase involved in cell wall biosynthesis